MDNEVCQVIWGSHACDLLPGHDGDHVCQSDPDDDEPCTQVAQDGTDARDGFVWTLAKRVQR